jgi:hypothetical protein
MATNYSPKIVTDGLVLCLDAANPKSYPSSGTTWKDLSGNDNDGTLIGSPSYSSNNLGEFTFTNDSTWVTGGYAEIPNSASLNNVTQFTLNFALYSLGSQSHNGASVFHKSAEGSIGFVCEPISNSIRLNYGNGTNWSWSGVTIPLVHNELAFYTFAYDSTTMFIYKNAELLSTHNIDIAWDNNNLVRIGRRRGHLQHYLYGKMYSETLHSRFLSFAEIQQNFQATRGRYGI